MRDYFFSSKCSSLAGEGEILCMYVLLIIYDSVHVMIPEKLVTSCCKWQIYVQGVWLANEFSKRVHLLNCHLPSLHI